MKALVQFSLEEITRLAVEHAQGFLREPYRGDTVWVVERIDAPTSGIGIVFELQPKKEQPS